MSSYPETFAADDPFQPRRSNRGCLIWGIIAGLVGGFGVLAVACCGGFVALGINVTAEQVAEDLRENPVVVEHVGNITSIKADWLKSVSTDDDTFVYDVTGTKGTARLRVVSESVGDGEIVVSGTLETPDGVRHDLFPHDPGPDDSSPAAPADGP